jgi:SAM-dependent methyltransferase
MKLTYEQLKQIADSVGERTGWNFSRVHAKRAPVPWDYLDVVRQFLTPTDYVLDIGTGGGEVFLTLAPYFRKGIGIDIDPEMIEQARKNKTAQQIANVGLAVMDTDCLEFPDGEFDVVLNRHCDVNVLETGRVLRAKGYFLTQQVACRNTLTVLEALGWTPASFGDGWWQPMDELAAEFERLGYQVVAKAEYDVCYWFCDVGSLVFWLKAVPLPEPFDVEKHWQGVNRLIEECSTERGVETNEHRELLIVQKV